MEDETEALFKDRIPAAAARQLATVLVTATEYHLETLELMHSRARTPQKALARQVQICKELVAQCVDLGVHGATGLRGCRCVRLTKAMAVVAATDKLAAERGTGSVAP